MGRGVKRVAEAEKGREKERVEKCGWAKATWREGGRELGVSRQEARE
jgi:ribosomal protein S14